MRNLNITFRVDEKRLATKFKVHSYPTLLLFKDGYYYSYKGNRTLDDFVIYVNENYTKSTEKFEIDPKINTITKISDYMVYLYDFGIAKIRVVPKIVKLIIVSTVFLLPLVFLCCCICSCKKTKLKQDRKSVV